MGCLAFGSTTPRVAAVPAPHIRKLRKTRLRQLMTARNERVRDWDLGWNWVIHELSSTLLVSPLLTPKKWSPI